jgi:hypothetical protein
MLDSLEGIVGGNPAPEAGDTAPTEEAPEPEEGSDSGADDGGDDRGSQGESSGEEDEPKSQDEPSDDDDDDEGESQGGSSDAPRESQTTPAPDDGTGGDPDASDFIGGSGDVDPARETEGHGGGGGLDMERAGSGAVDPAPETEDSGAGGLDMERLGIGVIDPLGGESSLLGDDTGDLAEMAAEADLIEVEVEFDDVLVDADIGEDV